MDSLTKTNTIYCKVSKCDKFINGKKECFGNYCLEYNTYTKLKTYEKTGLTPQQIVEMQNHLAEAMELLRLAKANIEDLKDCHHCNFNPLENCPGCDQYGENWKWQYADRYEELKQSTDINVGNINEVQNG